MADEGNSVVDLLKQDLKEISTQKNVYIRVPGFERSGLQVKYRLPENGQEIGDIGKKIERQHKEVFARNLYTAMDTMIVLCDGLFVQPDGIDEPVMLDYEETGTPCRFDDRLAAYLGMNGDPHDLTARSIVRKLFDDREFAIINHAEKLSRWLVDASADVNREFWQGE